MVLGTYFRKTHKEVDKSARVRQRIDGVNVYFRGHGTSLADSILFEKINPKPYTHEHTIYKKKLVLSSGGHIFEITGALNKAKE